MPLICNSTASNAAAAAAGSNEAAHELQLALAGVLVSPTSIYLKTWESLGREPRVAAREVTTPTHTSNYEKDDVHSLANDSASYAAPAPGVRKANVVVVSLSKSLRLTSAFHPNSRQQATVTIDRLAGCGEPSLAS